MWLIFILKFVGKITIMCPSMPVVINDILFSLIELSDIFEVANQIWLY
jgi:hypothetical protein